MAKCLICQEREATKKNSHIIPSFLVAMVTSYDGSYKRDKEILFLIKNFNTKYIQATCQVQNMTDYLMT